MMDIITQRHVNFIERIFSWLNTDMMGSTLGQIIPIRTRVVGYCILGVEHGTKEEVRMSKQECHFFFATSVWMPKNRKMWGGYLYPLVLDAIGAGCFSGLATTRQIRRLEDTGNFPFDVLKPIYEFELPDYSCVPAKAF